MHSPESLTGALELKIKQYFASIKDDHNSENKFC